MKWIVLRRREDGNYEHVGAPETPDADGDDETYLMRRRAIEAAAQDGGPHVAIPFDEWVMFNADKRIVVNPLPRAGEMPSPEEAEPVVAVSADDDMEGLARPGQRLP
jgi:hypothetical protein